MRSQNICEFSPPNLRIPGSPAWVVVIVALVSSPHDPALKDP